MNNQRRTVREVSADEPVGVLTAIMILGTTLLAILDYVFGWDDVLENLIIAFWMAVVGLAGAIVRGKVRPVSRERDR